MNKKISLSFCLLFAVTFFILSFTASVSAVPKSTDTEDEPTSFKVLSIGNSFSADAHTYLYKLAKAAGKTDIVIGNLYIGGCDISKHWENAKHNKAEYRYKKTTANGTKKISKVTISYALHSEKWDYITIQQSSAKSGIKSTYNSDLKNLIKYIKVNCLRSKAKIGWHMTWAYGSNFTSKDFESYGCNQDNMYNAISAAVKSKIADNPNISFIIPSGTAIQNIRTSYIKDRVTRDGRHLNNLGKYLAGMTYLKAITGCSIDSISWLPESDKVYKSYLPVIREAVNDAVENPFSVTKSSHKCSHVNSPKGIISTVVKDHSVAATCTKTGLTSGSHCSVCKKVIKKQQKVALAEHKFGKWRVEKKASLSNSGKKTAVCSVCQKSKTVKINQIKTVSLSRKSYVYDAKTHTPKLTVKDSAGKTLKKDTDYTVKVSGGRKNIGKYTVKVTFKGKYSGTKTLTFRIIPEGVSITNISPLSKGFSVKWKPQKNITGYIIAYSTSPDFKKGETKKLNIKNAKTASATVKKLTAGKKYYVRIQTYKTVKSGNSTENISSGWSKAVNTVIK